MSYFLFFSNYHKCTYHIYIIYILYIDPTYFVTGFQGTPASSGSLIGFQTFYTTYDA